jgi:8-oxo-dGTP pyrophosphatase MutT (NUDIX family)
MDIKKLIKNRINEITKSKQSACGVLIQCTKTDSVFLLKRNDEEPTWSLMSGMIEDEETPLEALKREFKEELSISPSDVRFEFIGIENNKNGVLVFHYYEGFVDEEFKPTLDAENLEYGWFKKDELPSPLFNGIKSKIENI